MDALYLLVAAAFVVVTALAALGIERLARRGGQR